MIILLSSFSLTLICIYCFQIIKWNNAWSNLKEQDTALINYSTKLTVIIPVRNEEAKIQTVLNSLLQQQYPKHLLEIVVSDDDSSDDTVKIAKSFFTTHPDFNGVVIENQNKNLSSKKGAIKRAIEIAKGELIITTDADCIHDTCWLQTLVAYYITQKPVMICGPVLMKGDDSLLQQFQTLDYLSLQTSGAASLVLNQPLLCSGANLAFTRNAFYDVKGYDDNLNFASGDDTFLMLKMHDRFPGKVHFIKSKNAVVTTNCSSAFKEFIQQRVRWVSKTKQYSNSFITRLGRFIFIANVHFLVLLLVSFFCAPLFIISCLYLLLKTIADYFFLAKAATLFNININKTNFLLMEVVYPFYLLALLREMARGSYQWKQRTHNS